MKGCRCLPRAKRVKSETGIYHVVLRGINKQTIFEDEEDYEMFLVTLNQYKKKSGYKLFAYCLMSNHIHLLMKTLDETLGQIFKRIGASYVYWYNQKYDRTGPLFQGRFMSEAVETDEYLMAVLRYIHQNPIKAGIVSKLENYVWSSYCEYIGLHDTHYLDKNFVLKLFHEKKKKAVTEFKAFNEIENDDKCLDISDRKRISDEKASQMIRKSLSITSPKVIGDFEPEKKGQCIKDLLNSGLSVHQLSRLTGISRYYITNLKQKKRGNGNCQG